MSTKQNLTELPNSIPGDKPDMALFTPTPITELDFPVTAAFINVSQMYLQHIRWQWHEELECVIVNNGQAKLQMSDTSLLLSPGEGALINQAQLHSVYAVGTEECSLYSLKFHPSLLFGYGKTLMSGKYLAPVLTSPNLRYLFLTEKENTPEAVMLNLINEVLPLCLTKHFGYELKVKGLLCDLWYQLLSYSGITETAETIVPQQNALDDSRVKQAITYIEDNHMQALTLDDIAASIHVSKSECCRCFQRTLGITPFEYLMRFRIFESTRKMVAGDENNSSISELAASVGFNSTSYYNKLFKKYMNCTPTEYRKTIQSSIKKNPGRLF